jgi:16S rRNA processing protein RimM
MTEPAFLLLGQVLRPQGVRGEVRINVLTAYPERIIPGTTVYLSLHPENVDSAVEYVVSKVRSHQQYLILQFQGVNDRNEADLLREQYVMVAFEDAVPLDEDEFYLFQAIGLKVFTEEGENLGEVTEILETGANDVYVVHGQRGEILLPAIDECIIDIDLDAGTMTVHLLDGLLGDQ